MRDNPLQFAVVREDPATEAQLIRNSGAENVLLIGSGGCKALSLQALFPRLNLTLVDSNPSQLTHIRRKIEALMTLRGAERKAMFNIGDDNAAGLNANGNFESLFRGFRQFVNEFISSAPETTALFQNKNTLQEAPRLLFKNKYWPVAFRLHFHDAFLEAMFGAAAIQHAPPGSYPSHFQKAFERGLVAENAVENPFLSHVLLGSYQDKTGALPLYLAEPVPQYRFQFIEGPLLQVPDFSRFDLVDLSNLFDWMEEASVSAIAQRLIKEMKAGANLVFRQLNHTKDFGKFFSSTFDFDDGLSKRCLEDDKSLFYSKINIAKKR